MYISYIKKGVFIMPRKIINNNVSTNVSTTMKEKGKTEEEINKENMLKVEEVFKRFKNDRIYRMKIINDNKYWTDFL